VKHLILALVLLATPAHAGGVCNDFWAGNASLTTTETTLWTQNIAAGSITHGNAIDVRVGGQATGTANQSATITVYLNGEWVGVTCPAGTNEAAFSDIRIIRTGTTTALVTGTMGLSYPFVSLGTQEVTGLNWAGAQTLAVKGQSNESGGAKFTHACVQR